MSTPAQITASDLEQAEFTVVVGDCSPNSRGINERTGITVRFTLRSGHAVEASTAVKIATPYASLMKGIAQRTDLRETLRDQLLRKCRASGLSGRVLFDALGLMV